MVSYENSIENLKFALTLTDEAEVVRDIKSNLAWAHSCQGRKLFSEAIKLESNNPTSKEEIKSKFEEARRHFEAANELDSAKYGQDLKKTVLKMFGNESFNEGSKIEKEAEDMLADGGDSFDDKDWTSLRERCEEALNHFEKAKENLVKAGEFDASLEASAEVARAAVLRTSDGLRSLKKIQLIQAAGKLTFDVYKFDKEEFRAMARRAEARVAEVCGWSGWSCTY